MLAVLTSGCSAALVDPCAGKPAACVGVHLDSAVKPLDQLRITLDQRSSSVELTPTTPATLDFPVRFAIELPAATTSARLDFDGLLGGEVRAHATSMVSIPASGHVDLATITLRAASGDGGGGDGEIHDGGNGDGDAAPDFDAAPPDLYGTVPLTITYSGNGSGQVTANGTVCASPGCTLNYAPGTIVNLVAAADAPVSTFNFWGGSCNTIADSCNITVSAATMVNADFRRVYQNLTVITNGSGSVTPSPVGVACGSGCWSYAGGTKVTLSETASGSSSFAGWGATSCGNAASCMLTVNSDTGVIANFTGPVNYVFITSTSYTIAQLDAAANPLTTADGFCQARASAAGLANAASYKAWLTTIGTTASSRLGSARGWVRMDGLPFADTVASLVAGGVFYPIALSDTKTAATVTPWTGADNDGTLADNCTNFTVASGQSVGGVPSGGALSWSNGGTVDCSTSAPLICFGTATSSPLTVTAPANARLAFLTQAGFAPTSPADGNALCAGEATTAGLLGNLSSVPRHRRCRRALWARHR